MKLTVLILTFNEAVHIGRAINSVADIASRIVVVDSGSTDETCAIASALGATVLKNPWHNYAAQFNWGLNQLPGDTEWVLRLDADEIVTPALAEEITAVLPVLEPDVDGAYVSRRMTFMRRSIRHGGVFPIRVLRIFRHGRGRCENRWMDEHILVGGRTTELREEILDDSVKSLTWWTSKHNDYASREVVDILNLEYRFMPHESVASLSDGQQAGLKRWLKEKIYVRLPNGLRALIYFLYRYIFRGGFLDGFEGTAFHVLQGFWYRYLVDAKLHEVRSFMETQNVDIAAAIEEILGINVRHAS